MHSARHENAAGHSHHQDHSHSHGDDRVEDRSNNEGGSGDMILEADGEVKPKNLQNLIFNLKKKAEAEQDIKVI